MTGSFTRWLFCAALCLAGVSAHAAQDGQAETALQLPPKIRAALIDEMAALQPAMIALAEAIPQGDWDRVADTAAAMRDGFILKKALTPAELQSLEEALPQPFLVMDARFHDYADRLAGAAHQRDRELVPFYFYRMTEACMNCHAAYAASRFPGYRPPGEAAHHHH